MKFKAFGREVDVDFANNGDPWDVVGLVNVTDQDGTSKTKAVQYMIRCGVLSIKAARPVTHYIFFRLMVTVYGKQK